MFSVRQWLYLIAALTLLLCGMALLVWHLTGSPVIRGMVVMAASSLIAAGGYWLWTDFISPDRHEG